jgi:hypothetical protein
MFIRKRKTPTGGVSYSLLEGIYTPNGTRQRVVACLGSCPTVAEALAARIIDGETNLTMLAVWEPRNPGGADARRAREKQSRIEKQVRVLIDALAMVGGTQAEVETQLPLLLARVNKARGRKGIEPVHTTEATSRWLRAIVVRLAGQHDQGDGGTLDRPR